MLAIEDIQKSSLAEQYDIVAEIGRGGFGVVYKAQQKATKQWVAIKMLLKSPQLDDIQTEQHDRFWREVKLAGKLKSPYVVRLIDAGFVDGNPYMVMEYIDGEPLSTLLSRGPLDFATTKRIMTHVLEALAEAHEHGIVHRDLKPDNIMVTGKGHRMAAKVFDFGIAGIEEDFRDESDKTVTQFGQIRGTPAYMAPEQLRFFAEPRVESDIYSLGLILLECLTGQRVVTGASAIDICQKQINDPVEIPPNLQGTGFDAIIAKACEKDFQNRYHSADEMLDDLKLVHVEEGQISTPSKSLSLKTSSLNEKAKSKILWLAIALGILVFIGIGIFFWKHSSPQKEKTTPVEVKTTPEQPPPIPEEPQSKPEVDRVDQIVQQKLKDAQQAQLAGDFKKALDNYNAILMLKPDHIEAQKNKGFALIQLRRFDEAIQTLEPLSQREFQWVVVPLADAYLAKNNLDRASELYQKYLEKYPQGTLAARARKGVEEIQVLKTKPAPEEVSPPPEKVPSSTKSQNTSASSKGKKRKHSKSRKKKPAKSTESPKTKTDKKKDKKKKPKKINATPLDI